jgi:hypothetical protein
MRGDLMGSRHLFASIPMACLMAVSFLGMAPVANAESGAVSAKPGKSAKHNVIGTKRRFRSVRIHLPMGPGYVYYDYPYYYCRGHYPTHIGGYVYYPSYYRCTYNWGYRGAPGTLRHHRARSN